MPSPCKQLPLSTPLCQCLCHLFMSEVPCFDGQSCFYSISWLSIHLYAGQISHYNPDNFINFFHWNIQIKKLLNASLISTTYLPFWNVIISWSWSNEASSCKYLFSLFKFFTFASNSLILSNCEMSKLSELCLTFLFKLLVFYCNCLFWCLKELISVS